MTIQFRTMKPSDRDGIITVHKRSVDGLCDQIYSKELRDVWTSLFKQKFSNEGIKNPDHRGIVAVDDDGIVGYGFIGLKDGEIKGMYLLPELAGQGIGRQILSQLEVLARENKLNELVLDSTLNAVGFYKRCGYHEAGKRVFELTKDRKLNCVRMTKELL